jgi:hypothetical protein
LNHRLLARAEARPLPERDERIGGPAAKKCNKTGAVKYCEYRCAMVWSRNKIA